MAQYTIAFPVNTGDPGSTLSAQVVALNGAPVGLQPTWVVVPGGGGFFGLYASNVDDSLNGGNYWIVVTDTNGGRVVDMRPTTFGLTPQQRDAFKALYNGVQPNTVTPTNVDILNDDGTPAYTQIPQFAGSALIGFKRVGIP